MKPDVLADLSAAARLRKEREDMDYIMQYGKVARCDDEEEVELVKQRTGVDISSMPVADPDDIPNAIVCMRVDLAHPIMLADNLIGQCDDCGCDVQFRPNLSQDIGHLCICCTARNMREDANNENQS